MTKTTNHRTATSTLRRARDCTARVLAAAGCLFAATAISCASEGDRKMDASAKDAKAAAAMNAADPQMKAVLDSLAELNPKPIETLTPAEARLQPSPTDAVMRLLQKRGNAEPQAVGKVEMKTVPGPGGASVPVRVYTPKGDAPQGGFPVIVYFHGGGWVLATLDTYDASCRALTDLAGAVVVSVDYRRAPEHKFPAAHEDCYAAFQYVAANAAQFGGDPNHVAVAGESAGGNLATGVCLMAQERKGRMPIHQGLVYPVADHNFDTPSYKENAQAKPLNAAMMPWFFKQYLNNPADADNVLISPLRAAPDRLRALPPATVVTAQIDPLRSEGMAYAEKLKAAGVDVASKNYDGVTHEFFGMAAVVDKAKEAEQFLAGRLKQAFQGAKPQ